MEKWVLKDVENGHPQQVYSNVHTAYLSIYIINKVAKESVK